MQIKSYHMQIYEFSKAYHHLTLRDRSQITMQTTEGLQAPERDENMKPTDIKPGIFNTKIKKIRRYIHKKEGPEH